MDKNNIFRVALVFAAVAVIALMMTTTGSEATPRQSQVFRDRIKVTTSAAGNGTANSALIQGQIVRVDLNYLAGISNTADVTIYGVNDLVTQNIVSETDSVTDIIIYPTVGLTDNDGAAVTYDGTRQIKGFYSVSDIMTVAISQTTESTSALTVDIYWIGE